MYFQRYWHWKVGTKRARDRSQGGRTWEQSSVCWSSRTLYLRFSAHLEIITGSPSRQRALPDSVRLSLCHGSLSCLFRDATLISVRDGQEYRWMTLIPKCSVARVAAKSILSPHKGGGESPAVWILFCLQLEFSRGFWLAFLPPVPGDARSQWAGFSFCSRKHSVSVSSDKGYNKRKSIRYAKASYVFSEVVFFFFSWRLS